MVRDVEDTFNYIQIDVAVGFMTSSSQPYEKINGL